MDINQKRATPVLMSLAAETGWGKVVACLKN